MRFVGESATESIPGIIGGGSCPEKDTEAGRMKCPSIAVRDPSLRATLPFAAWKICTRSPPLSATAIRVPSGEYAACVGRTNCPLATPCDSNAPAKMPLCLNICTRLLPASATIILVPSGDHAADAGASSCPVPLPRDPRLKAALPLAA